MILEYIVQIRIVIVTLLYAIFVKFARNGGGSIVIEALLLGVFVKVLSIRKRTDRVSPKDWRRERDPTKRIPRVVGSVY